MCLRPVYIKNPSYYGSSFSSECGDTVLLPRRLSPATEYITVPCGKCDDCRSSYYNSLLQRALCESLSSYMFFVTLTYDNEHIPSVQLPNGRVVFYVDYSDVQNMMKRFRAANLLDRDFRYLCVNEYGDTNSRPHIHMLIFVAKLDSDTRNTPLFIRDILFHNLGYYFSRNVGTRKNPRYEQLFSYTVRQTSFGLMSNYYVEFVDPNKQYEYLDSSDVHSDVYIKTIRYLIGYVNKGSSFDDTIHSYLQESADDVILCSKLADLLRSKVRFSKGFGCGFVDGQKFYLPKISVKASYSSLVYTDIVNNFPETFDELCSLHPDTAQDLLSYISADRYRIYKCLKHYLNDCSDYTYYLHCLYLRYFPNEFSRVYDKYYAQSYISNPKVSYFFRFVSRDYRYYKPKVNTVLPGDSSLYKFLREGVEQGLRAACPFIAFKWHGQQQFTALCKYYKERVCTSADIIAMYDALNVRNYEQWQSLFTRQLSLHKTNISHGNRAKYANNSDNILKYQKHCLISFRHIKGLDLYTQLVSNCK